MDRFNGVWTKERIKDLMIVHKGRNHTDTASNLSIKWNFLVTRDVVKNKYNSLLASNKIKSNPDLVIEPSKSREFYDKSQNDQSIKGKRVYFITSAIAGCSLDLNFFRSVQTFCKARNAKLVVFPMRGITNKDEEYNKDVLDNLEKDFYTDYIFNSNIEGFDLMLSPTMQDPLSGLYKLAQKKSSLILASSKQEMRIVPVSNTTIPHILHSTGAITKSSYPNNRIGLLSSEEHVVGGLILEIENDTIFHLRQIQTSPDGCFYDLNKRYCPHGVYNSETEVFVMGDLHVGQEDQTALDAWLNAISLLKPKQIFLHDLFDSKSISHHTEVNLTEKSNQPDFAKSLEIELDNLCTFIKKYIISRKHIKFFVVASNHDFHLSRYLDEGRFFKDYLNYRLALKLALYRCENQNPIEAYIESKLGKIKNLIWLKVDEDLKFQDIQLASHGHIGIHGSYGSIASAEKSYYKAIIAHSHVPGIQGGIWQVGTTTKLRLSYNQGPSAWVHGSAIIQPDGNRQMIFSIEGSWRL